MATSDYYQLVQDTLLGKTPATAGIPAERLDWSGLGAVLRLYEAASGPERDQLVQALGRIIEEGKGPPSLLAQVLHLAASLDLAQLEPSVQKLKTKAAASQEPVQSALANYLAFRQLATYQPEQPSPAPSRRRSPRKPAAAKRRSLSH